MAEDSEVTRLDIDDPDVEIEYDFCTYRGKPFTGEVAEYGSNGQMVGDGIQRGWYYDGAPRSEVTTRHGRTIGPARSWYPSGQLKQEAEFDGVDYVRRRAWAEDGTLIDDWTAPERT